MNKHKITKKEFDSLYDSNITHKQYNKILEKIDKRFQEIVLTMIPGVRKKGWYDYGNCSYEGENSNGSFDPDEYKDEISVGGEFALLPEPYRCDNSFPTRWLWEDFEEEFNDTVLKYKLEEEKESLIQKQNREALKLKKTMIWESVKQKLTKEELKYVCLK
jgi:hypothetical protein